MSKHRVVKDLRGEIIAPYDLPPSNTVRWTPQRKSVVILAVRGGLCTLEDVLERYHMTETEFQIWEKELKEDGIKGLKITKYQQNRIIRKRTAQT